MSLTPPPLGGKYRLKKPLAKGGMGKIWVGEHIELGTEVAIKRLDMEPHREAAWTRFRREATILAQLKSRHIVHIYDLAEDAEGPYIVMELLAGEDLSNSIQRNGRLELPRALDLLDQLGKALTVAHAAGVVHRDIKPSNVFLAHEAGEELPIVKVLDFGISKQLGVGTNQATLTETGHLVGSPGYMSPEQIRGKAVDARTDVWGVTALFYELLVGRSAFNLEHVGDTLFNICQGTYSPIGTERPELKGMEALFVRGFAPSPDDRYPSVSALVAAAHQLGREVEAGASPDSSDARTPTGTTRGHDSPNLTRPSEPNEPGAQPPERTRTMDAFSGEAGLTPRSPQTEAPRRSRAWVPLLLVVLALSALAQFWPRSKTEPDAATGHDASEAERGEPVGPAVSSEPERKSARPEVTESKEPSEGTLPMASPAARTQPKSERHAPAPPSETAKPRSTSTPPGQAAPRGQSQERATPPATVDPFTGLPLAPADQASR